MESKHITVPLAKTPFLNGKLSTLFTSKWMLENDSFVQIGRQVERRNVVVNVLGGLSNKTRTLVPALPLTAGRPILSGLGNIVRTIRFPGSEGEQPASKELEKAVTEYLSSGKVDSSSIQVWALIVPKKVLNSTRKLPGGPFKEHSKPGYIYRPSFRSIPYWLDNGASLCRVRKSSRALSILHYIHHRFPTSLSYRSSSVLRVEWLTLFSYSKWWRRLGREGWSSGSRPANIVRIHIRSLARQIIDQ